MAISKETEEKETFKRIVIHFYNDNCGLPKESFPQIPLMN